MALELQTRKQWALVCMFCVLRSAPGFAAVNDVLLADYFPLATGSSTLPVYAYDRKADDCRVRKGDADRHPEYRAELLGIKLEREITLGYL